MRSKLADCRKCIYFVPVEKFEENDMLDLLEEVEIYRAKHGIEILGWCDRFRRFVKYYKGRCRGFEKQYSPPAKNPITYYLSNR